MRDRELYARLLGIAAPWHVHDVALRLEEGEVHVRLAPEAAAHECPRCGAAGLGYDTRERRWRHLDTRQYRTIVIADVPRVRCATHGVVQIAVPWADAGARFTALFEALVIDGLHEASLAAVARRLHLSWDEVDDIQQRAVARGLARRPAVHPQLIGVDETSFQKHHEYVTVVCDLERDVVLYVADDWREDSLAAFYEQLSVVGCATLDVIAMDMWRPYIAATSAAVPADEGKLVFDKFHVARLLSIALDQVRPTEHRALRPTGARPLAGTKYLWLANAARMDAARMDAARWRPFGALRRSTLKTARAWALKEMAMVCWQYVRRAWAAKAWAIWFAWAARCRLPAMQTAAQTLRSYLWGILNAIVSGATNAWAEGLNARIQAVKRRECGYRNRERFRHAIYFHLGGLDLSPDTLSHAHPTS
ncbi:MAG: ISL3 family transposase [Gemmatimonadetes bacterium]|nr:ISL3 family transposase [Gemmatimonadota bacterium]